MMPGDMILVEPGEKHSLLSLKESVVFEIATEHYKPEDTFI